MFTKPLTCSARVRRRLCVAAASVALAACGGSDDQGAVAPSTEPVAATVPSTPSTDGNRVNTNGAGAEGAEDLEQDATVQDIWMYQRIRAVVADGSVVDLTDIEGPGAIQHIWIGTNMSLDKLPFWRWLVLRFHWDDEDQPSVEVPLGDFFCNGWCVPSGTSSCRKEADSKWW